MKSVPGWKRYSNKRLLSLVNQQQPIKNEIVKVDKIYDESSEAIQEMVAKACNYIIASHPNSVQIIDGGAHVRSHVCKALERSANFEKSLDYRILEALIIKWSLMEGIDCYDEAIDNDQIVANQVKSY